VKAPVRSTVFLSALAGLLATISFAPFNWPLVGWFAPWPIFILADRYRHSLWKMIGAGLLVAFFICSFAFYWTVYLFVVYGGLPVWMSLFVFAAHTFFLNLKIPLFLVSLGLLRRRRFRTFRVMPVLLVPLLGLFFDRFTPQIFNWYWGNAIAGNPYLVQAADLAGIHGLTFLFFVISYSAYRAVPVVRHLLRMRGSGIMAAAAIAGRPIVLRRFAVPVLILFVWFTYGVIQKMRYESLQSKLPHVRVAALQPNAPLEKYGEHRVTEEVIDHLLKDTIPALAERGFRAADGRLDLIVLPESAVPYYTTQNDELTRRLGLYNDNFESMIIQLSSGYSTPVFFNEIAIALSRDRHTGRPRIDAYNSSSVYNREGRRAETYHKRILIAFGEQIPFAEFLDETGLIQLVPESVRYSRFRPGDRFVMMPYGYSDEQRFLPLICYEILDPEFVRDFVRSGVSDFMVNITQDRWYGKTIETFQHYELGRIRAVETRKAIVRSTNSGTSGMVDLAGNYAMPFYGPVFTAQDVEEVQVFDVPVHRNSYTVFVRFGNHWMWIPVVFYAVVLVVQRVRLRR
jgi:apolipoprotein N-acyltransferase